ncbi:Aldo/keto reductase [Trametes elegans]|nr:Aldo/keto reductase [Trametes elegans]
MAKPEQKSALNVVMGVMTFGEKGKECARVHNLKHVEVILDISQSHGHYEVDTAREEFLGKIYWKKHGLTMGTKLHPFVDLRKWLDVSLKALQTDSIDMWYLHGPDRTTPYEETLRGVNELYKEGKFKCFGISNYMSWEVAKIVTICKANGACTAYQGVYNAILRRVEPELSPCLRKFGIAFYEFNPLGGGFFTGWYRSVEDKNYRNRHYKEQYFTALAQIGAAAAKHRLTLAEVAPRWISYHSLLEREHGDAVLIGASSVNHIEQNLLDLEKGLLPEVVVKVLDEAWLSVSPYPFNYWH